MEQRYEFVVRGDMHPDAIPALTGFSRSERGGYVVLTGALPEHLRLPDVLAQFEALGLGLHDVRELGDDTEAGEGPSWPPA